MRLRSDQSLLGSEDGLGALPSGWLGALKSGFGELEPQTHESPPPLCQALHPHQKPGPDSQTTGRV